MVVLNSGSYYHPVVFQAMFLCIPVANSRVYMIPWIYISQISGIDDSNPLILLKKGSHLFFQISSLFFWIAYYVLKSELGDHDSAKLIFAALLVEKIFSLSLIHKTVLFLFMSP